MRAPATWIQWTVVFTVLGIGGWIVYPAIDPFEPTANKPGLMGLRQKIFGPATPQQGNVPRAKSETVASATGLALRTW